MNVVKLSACRDLLDAWNALRAQIISGEIHGLAICIKGQNGAEHALFVGDYRDDPDAALKASLRMSWELTQTAEAEVPRSRPAPLI